MKPTVKYAITFMVMAICMGTAVIIPVEGFWTGFLRGTLIGIFIYLIPAWLRAQPNKETEQGE